MQGIKILEPTEQRVVIQRWGLDRRTPLTRAEIALQMEGFPIEFRSIWLEAL